MNIDMQYRILLAEDDPNLGMVLKDFFGTTRPYRRTFRKWRKSMEVLFKRRFRYLHIGCYDAY